MSLSLITAGLSILSGAKDLYKQKQELQKIEREAEIEIKKAEVVSRIKLAESQHTNNTTLDASVINKPGWMDELIGITAFTPLVFSLIVAPLAAVVSSFGYEPVAQLIPVAVSSSEALIQAPVATAIYDSYDIAFQQMKEYPREYWIFVALSFVHFLGMRGFVTQVLSSAANLKSSVFSPGTSKK